MDKIWNRNSWKSKGDWPLWQRWGKTMAMQNRRLNAKNAKHM